MFGNDDKMDKVVKLAKGLYVHHKEELDMAFNLAYTYVHGHRPQRQPGVFERKFWRCNDYDSVSALEYQMIKKAYNGS